MDISTLPGMAQHWAKTCPDRVWLKDLKEEGSDDYTWGESWEQISAIAAMLETIRAW
jgi:long-chain acyl-CoA synthetase